MNWQYCETVKTNTDFITFVILGKGSGYEFVNLDAPVSLGKIFASKKSFTFFSSAGAEKPDPFLLRFSWCASNFSFQFVSRFYLAQNFSFFKSTHTHFGNRVGNGISFRKKFRGIDS